MTNQELTEGLLELSGCSSRAHHVLAINRQRLINLLVIVVKDRSNLFAQSLDLLAIRRGLLGSDYGLGHHGRAHTCNVIHRHPKQLFQAMLGTAHGFRDLQWLRLSKRRVGLDVLSEWLRRLRTCLQ